VRVRVGARLPGDPFVVLVASGVRPETAAARPQKTRRSAPGQARARV
jgi:hypothetical protein